jgi:hypothetical protein
MYRDRFRKIHLQYEPWVVPFLDTEAAAEFSLIADLYTGKMTYGAFNSQRIELRNRSVEAVRQRYQELVREREAAIQKQQQELGEQQRAIAEHQRYERFIAEQRRLAEINRQAQLAQQAQAQYNFERAMALARFQAFLQSRQLINQTYGPTRMAPFSCTRFGNTIDCY